MEGTTRNNISSGRGPHPPRDKVWSGNLELFVPIDQIPIQSQEKDTINFGFKETSEEHDRMEDLDKIHDIKIEIIDYKADSH